MVGWCKWQIMRVRANVLLNISEGQIVTNRDQIDFLMNLNDWNNNF